MPAKPSKYTRIPLDVEPEFAEELDLVLAELFVKDRVKLTRTAFVREAVREKIARIRQEWASGQSSDRR